MQECVGALFATYVLVHTSIIFRNCSGSLEDSTQECVGALFATYVLVHTSIIFRNCSGSLEDCEAPRYSTDRVKD
jgi:hypothetical protein